MSEMTKDEALKKVAELEQYIKDGNKPKGVVDFDAGDVFQADNHSDTVIAEVGYSSYEGNKRYAFTGLYGNPCKWFSRLYAQPTGYTKSEMRKILNERGAVKVGKAVIQYDNSISPSK